MDEQAVVDAYTLFKGSGYNGTQEDFIGLLSEDQNALTDSYNLFRTRGYNGSGQDYMALLGLEGEFMENPDAEESTTITIPEEPVEDWQAIEDTNNMEHADWWNDHSDLGTGFGDWSFEIDKTNPADEGTWSRTLSDGSVQTIGEKTTLDSDGFQVKGWQSNFLDEDAAAELGEQLELQKSQKKNSHQNYNNTGELTEDSAEETDFQVKTADFNRKNPDLNVFDYEVAGSLGLKHVETGELIDITDPTVDERFKEIHDILSVKKAAEDKDLAERKAAGAEGVMRISSTYGMWKSDDQLAEWLNGETEKFTRYGFKAEDHEFTWTGYGTVRITNSEGETFGFDYDGDGVIGDDEKHILADGGMETVDGAMDAFNDWLRSNAIDFGSGVIANIEATGLNTNQNDKARKDAASKTTNYYQNKLYLEDKEEQDALHEDIMREAAASIRTSRFPNGYPSYEAYLQDVKDRFGGTSQSRKETVTAFNEWLYANLERFPDAAKYGFEIADNVTGQGWEIKKLTEDGWETVDSPQNVFRKLGLSTGYQAGTAFFTDHDLTDPANQVVNAATERVWKSEFINNINKAIQDNDPDGTADAERLGITAPGLSYELSQEISGLSKEQIEDWENTFSQDLKNFIEANVAQGSSVNDFINSISVSADNLEARRSLDEFYFNNSAKSMIYDNVVEDVESKSNNFLEKEEQQVILNEAAEERWSKLDQKSKNAVNRKQKVSAELAKQTKLYEDAVKELDALRFDGMTAEEALAKIRGGTYTTQAEVDAAIAKSEQITNAHNLVAKKVKAYRNSVKVYQDLNIKLQGELSDLNVDLQDLSWYKEVIDDNTAVGYQSMVAFTDGAIEIGQGFIGMGGMLGDVVMEGSAIATGLWNGEKYGEEYEAVKRWYSETAWGDRRVQYAIDDWQAQRQEHTQQISLDNIDSMTGFGEWAMVALAGQAPQLAMMMATSGLGGLATRGAVAAGTMSAARAAKIAEYLSLGTMGATSMGTKWESMRLENELYGADYSLGQMLLTSIGTGAVEAFSEKLTYDLLKGATSPLSKRS